MSSPLSWGAEDGDLAGYAVEASPDFLGLLLVESTGSLEQQVRNFAEGKGIQLGAIAQPLRAALTGSAASPGIFWVMEVLGPEESRGRIADAAEAVAAT